ncbi:MAG: carboxypeptidase regulatory-like domain-containing protein [Acidobacteria bacterium]|nr:carboxypeptidase regulatory-like domain-containing protein [Acidobacteriota bacterium]
MTRNIRCWLAVWSLGWAAALYAQSPATTAPAVDRAPKPAASRDSVQPTGAIAGRVTDRRGQPQAGVAVTILRQDGRYLEKVFTQPSGSFRLGNLLPGLYAAEVALPSFLPFWKGSIAVETGAEFLLDVSLLSLADSVEISLPDSLKTASEDWKWALRASYPARPILRLQPAPRHSAGGVIHDPRERALRGTVQFLAGNESHGFGQDPALRTAFDMAYALPSSQQLALAGFAGWEQSTPAASMRAAWNRRSGDAASSTLSMTVRQLFLPGEYWLNQAGLPGQSDRRVQSLTLGYEEEKILGEHLRLQMGSLYDTLHFGRLMTRWSPFGRVTYLPSENSRFTVAYTGANPRVLPTESDQPERSANQGLAIPQVSSDGAARPVLEGGRHIEAQWEQRLSPLIRFQVAAFYDQTSQTALSLAFTAPDEFTSGLLRDPFSDRYFLSGGGASSPGARLAVATRLSPDTEIIVGYTYAGTLEAGAGDLAVEDAPELRALLHTRGESSFTVKMNSRIPRSHTRVITSYRWLVRNAVAISDPYDRGWGQSDPYLNVYILQPIPSPDIFPGQFEAVADFSNLLAQGYLTVRSAGGTVGTLFPAPRSFRGGFNFIF